MKRINKIRTMTIEELAELIVDIENIDFNFCKSDCDGDWESEDPTEICPHPVECCIRWLGEEWEEGACFNG